MKAKTIKSVLSRKHAQFAESIEDDKVRKLVEKNSIITGGSIVSMLLNEKVNDFDYYFTDKETVVAVAEYYLAKFKETHPDYADTRIDVKDDGRVKIVVPSVGIAADEDYRDEETDESVTLFDDNGLEHLGLDDLKEEKENEDKPKFRPVFLSSNAISLSGKIQLVLRFYGDAAEIHSNYDFVHATCYWTSKNGHLELPQKALEAILTKELIYTGSKYPLCSIFRTKKFIKRGWQINAGQYLKMALQLNEMNLLDLETLQEQLTGVDSAYFAHVIDKVANRQKDDPNFKLDNTYLFEVINRIF